MKKHQPFYRHLMPLWEVFFVINSFNEAYVRDSGIIYNSVFEQIKLLYASDPQLAGEVAISAIELVLTQQMSSDNPMIELLLVPTKVINDRNVDNYNKKLEAAKINKITSNHLDEIAKMSLSGMSQAQIGKALNISQQTVSSRLKTIRQEFPELLGLQAIENLQAKNNTYKQNACKNGSTSVSQEIQDNLPILQDNSCDYKENACNKMVQDCTTGTSSNSEFFVKNSSNDSKSNEKDEKPRFYF